MIPERLAEIEERWRALMKDDTRSRDAMALQAKLDTGALIADVRRLQRALVLAHAQVRGLAEQRRYMRPDKLEHELRALAEALRDA